jgi:hypothetical protein
VKLKLKLVPLLGPPPDSPQITHLRIEIEKMVRLLREALGDGVAEDLARALKTFVEHGDDIERAAVAGIELIAVLVQGAEHRYTSGRGRLKKAQVTSAVRYLLRSESFDIPEVPRVLEPFVIDVLADWSIDFVVSISNEHGLWETREPVLFSPRATVAAILHGLAVATRPIWLMLAAFLARAWESLQDWSALTPEIKAALDKVIKAKLVAQKKELLGEVPVAVVWLADHRDQVTAALQLVFEAVQEAESFLSKSGPEKKEYARDLVLATLEELGFPATGLFGLIVQTFVDAAIESAVNLFNRFPSGTSAFHHRTGR